VPKFDEKTAFNRKMCNFYEKSEYRDQVAISVESSKGNLNIEEYSE